jgi:uncharacterized membrane protein YuzA (DUF378 family)
VPRDNTWEGECLEMRMTGIDWLSRILVIIGGLNWGTIGTMGYNFVEAIFGIGTMASRIVYSLVGLAALYELIRLAFREPVTERRE